jgi:hypothetical protein
VAGANNEQQRRRHHDLDEGAHALEEQGSRRPGRDGGPGLGREALVEERVAERALDAAAVEHEQLAPVALQPGDDGRAATGARVRVRAIVEARRGVVAVVQHQRLHEDLDGATTGEPDLPRLLVAEVQLEQSRAHAGQDVFGLLDDLRVDASADGDGAHDVAVFADDHLGPFLPRRGPARVDQGGHGDPALGPAQLVNVIEGFRHATFIIRSVARKRNARLRARGAARGSVTGVDGRPAGGERRGCGRRRSDR